jgi:hypothetical protein
MPLFCLGKPKTGPIIRRQAVALTIGQLCSDSRAFVRRRHLCAELRCALQSTLWVQPVSVDQPRAADNPFEEPDDKFSRGPTWNPF